MTHSRKAATDAGPRMEANADQLDGPAWGSSAYNCDEIVRELLGCNRQQEHRWSWRNVLSAVLALVLVAGTVLLVAIYKVGE